MSTVLELAQRAKSASKEVARASGEAKNEAMTAMAKSLMSSIPMLLEENSKDLEAARAGDSPKALMDRLTLSEKRIQAMADGLLAVAEQPDPVGEVVDEWTRPNGLRIQRVRAPLGVVAVIYEARPNVTTDVVALCLKAGNAAVLRGSSHALRTNLAICSLLGPALASAGLPEDAVVFVDDTSRDAAAELIRLKGMVDLLVPRGGADLIRFIEESATVPTIIDGDGNCHIYVDRAADPEMATEIVLNAKTQRFSVCNAAETLLVHADLAGDWLPRTLDRLAEAGVEVRGDARTRGAWPRAVEATEDDWAREYLDLIIAVRVVAGVDEAIEHVNRWGTSNAEAIVTEDLKAARRFSAEVDSGSIFINTSTRFSDGGQFGYGAEIGISTQKLHARGPMGARELTCTKYVVWGDGQLRS